MKTRNDLIAAALFLLQADGGAGQTPAPEDVDAIDKFIDGMLDEIAFNKAGYYGPDAFEDRVVDPIAVFIANSGAPGFGQARDDGRRLSALNRLRVMQPSTYVGQPLQVDYF